MKIIELKTERLIIKSTKKEDTDFCLDIYKKFIKRIKNRGDEMNISFLTSGFPNGFTDEFVRCIKDCYNNNGLFTFIASDFEQHSKTDKYI